MHHESPGSPDFRRLARQTFLECGDEVVVRELRYASQRTILFGRLQDLVSKTLKLGCGAKSQDQLLTQEPRRRALNTIVASDCFGIRDGF